MNKYFRMTSVVGLMLCSAALFAQSKEDEHASHHPAGDAPAVITSSDSKQAAPATMPQMQDNMKKMQEQMAKINSSKDPAERKALLAQHMQAMHQQMDMMRSMMGSSMMGKQGEGKEGGGMMNCGQMMGGNMDMMQMMMNQMQQHSSAEEKTKPAK